MECITRRFLLELGWSRLFKHLKHLLNSKDSKSFYEIPEIQFTEFTLGIIYKNKKFELKLDKSHLFRVGLQFKFGDKLGRNKEIFLFISILELQTAIPNLKK